MHKFYLGFFLGMGLVATAHITAGELIEKNNFPSHQQMSKIFDRVGEQTASHLLKNDVLSEQEARVTFFRICQNAKIALKQEGFEVQTTNYFPQSQKDVTDEDVQLFIKRWKRNKDNS